MIFLSRFIFCVVLLSGYCVGGASPLFAGIISAESSVPVREDFDTLTNWQPLYFKKIKRHSSYKIVRIKGNSYLEARSNNSASCIILQREFTVDSFPVLKWRWRVNSVYKNGNALTRKGDDYPLRIYVLFAYDPKNANIWEKVKYESAKLLYGRYPPYSSLNYIWANRDHELDIITNSFTDRAKLIVMDSGKKKVGQWVEHTVNIVDDYKRAFGTPPPVKATIAIMNDSDNTGEKSTSWVDYIELSR